MFSKAHVVAALEAKGHRFHDFDLRTGQERQQFEDALAELEDLDREQLEQRLQGIDNPGACPTRERLAKSRVVKHFDPSWANHAEARAWAISTLRGVPTVAVDGSQITPSRDFSIPVGAVQVGWFENLHDASGEYAKDIRFEVLPPEELAGDESATQTFPDRLVNARRFELECEILVEHMRRMAGREQRPVCFFDGSLIISFAARMAPDLQHRYVNAVLSLLDTSEETRVPLVGYVDTSYARDLVWMLHWVQRGETVAPTISDGALLRRQMSWGDRTEAFVCARDDKLNERANQSLRYYDRVHFLYLKTTAHNAPSRLDLPAWLLEEDLLDWVVDVVRAECVVGTGYPYAVETADAVAVITMQDRERFYRVFQEFVDKMGLGLRYSRKAYSKRGRR